MKRLLAPLLAAAVLSPAAVASAPLNAASPAAAVGAGNRLALELLSRIGGAGNTVFSPYSIQAALAMIDQGAAGKTAAQIGQLLGDGDSGALAASESMLARQLRGVTVVPTAGSAPAGILPRLDIANGLWAGPSLPLEQQFRNRLLSDFGAAPQTFDFAGGPDAARQAINAWIAQRTAHLIRDVMSPGSITAQTRLVLANAIYLKARWGSPFVKSATADAPFVTASGQRVTAPFMTQPATEFGYARADGYRAIELPYVDSTLSMLLVVPAPGTLTSFEHHVPLADIVRSLRTQLVDLRMPRFRLAFHGALNPVLEALGMPLAFSDGADFRGITHSVALKVQAVEHGATLTADEQGTAAAAATGISTEPTAILGGPTVQLTLNHPFLLFLRDRNTGAVLFAGRVVNPAQS